MYRLRVCLANGRRNSLVGSVIVQRSWQLRCKGGEIGFAYEERLDFEGRLDIQKSFQCVQVVPGKRRPEHHEHPKPVVHVDKSLLALLHGRRLILEPGEAGMPSAHDSGQQRVRRAVE
eukprot:scaffold733_cov267-Pinguiococcus_pyrenoidosus.AAC.6